MQKGFNFDLDDPLGDILSDASDDSFFGGSKNLPSKKKPAQTAVIDQKKSSLFDLDDEPTASKSPSRGLSKSVEALSGKTNDVTDDFFQTTEATRNNKLGSTSNDKLDFQHKSLVIPAANEKSAADASLEDSDTGIPVKKKLNFDKKKSTSTIFDDILGAVENKEKKKPIESDFNIDDILGIQPQTRVRTKSQSESKKPGSQIETKKAATQKLEVNKKSGFDWLAMPEPGPLENEIKRGLKTTNVKREIGAVESTKEKAGLPSWLLGKEEDIDSKKKFIKPEATKVDIPENSAPEAVKIEEQKTPELPKLLSSENFVEESTALCLQQEEQQVMVALQLKAQEEKLAALQERQKDASRVQKELLLGQQSQVSSLLERQAERRKQMQDIILRHQEKINERIKSLLMGADDTTPSQDDCNKIEDISPTPKSSEKQQLLQLIETLQANHDKEIDLLDNSYRRQLAFVELASNQLEDCMKEEKEKLIVHYDVKVKWLEQQYQMNQELYQKNVSSVQELYRAELEKMKKQHEDSVRILQEQHTALIDNLRNSVKHDQNIIQDATTFSQNVTELVADVKESKAKMEEFMELVTKAHDDDQRLKERKLQARERQVDDLLEQLKLEKEHFHLEQVEKREATKLLEDKLRILAQTVEEQNKALKRERLEFEFEKETFSKQSELANSSNKKQQEQIKKIKEDYENEYNTRFKMLEEDRNSLRSETERVAIERGNLNKLKQDIERMKIDLQVQLEQVTEERAHLNQERQRNALDEQKIVAKSRELDELTRRALEKQTDAERKISEAESSRRSYEAKLIDVQEYTNSLVLREKNIAKEKVGLSRERLNLHNERKKQLLELNTRQTWAQHTDNIIYGTPNSGGVILNNFGYESVGRSIIPPPTMADDHEFVDPKLLLLKLDIEKVLKNLKDNRSNENNDYNEK